MRKSQIFVFAVYLTACNAARTTVYQLQPAHQLQPAYQQQPGHQLQPTHQLHPTHQAAPPPSSTTPPPAPPTRQTPRMAQNTPPPLPASTTNCEDANSTTNPLGRLRNAMRNPGYTQSSDAFDAFLVFYSDEHLSEEPSADERRLEYISGWAGVGTAAVVADAGADGGAAAAVWVPAGDLKRARAALSCAWIVLDADNPTQPTIAEWLAERMARKMRVGADARLTSFAEWQTLVTALQNEGLILTHVPTLLDQLWQDEMDPTRRRPEFSRIVANLHNPEYTGINWLTKVSMVRSELQSVGADAMVVTALDEVAWLLNIRGRDVPHAPLLKAFVVVSAAEIRVYAPAGKLSMPVRDALAAYQCYTKNCTKVIDYNLIYSDLRRSSEAKILIPTGGTFQRGASAAITQSVSQIKRLFYPSPIIYLKAQKNAAEIKGMKKAHLRDAVAMSTLLSYIEDMMRMRTPLTELSVAEKVRATISTQAGYVGDSMTIRVAFGPNGAEPEYLPTNKTNRRVMLNATLIIQSGGQYDEGTTMVTRTLQYGPPAPEIRKAYTTVLRSLAALATLQIPATLPAAHVDPVVRAPLWANRQDYPYPTGHGIGAALNRREDPVVLDYRQDTNLHTFRDGYFITAEPAWYDPRYGVRLCNVLQVVSKNDSNLGFLETTLLPFEPKLIDSSLLTEYEINWLNSYNKRIRNTLGPELKDLGLTDIYYWMMNKTILFEPPSMAKKCVYSSAGRTQAVLLGVLSSIIISFL